ncbi:MAG: stage II sporulation protein M [Micrococcales bacterium]|nr:stage II sporulation protein M [Micrococcales bacterium]
MDLDAYTFAHEPDWVRLEALSKRSRLTGAEVDELVRLYQATATDLSTVRSSVPDPRTVMRLSQLLSRARTRLTGAHAPVWHEVATFFTVSFPVVLYRIRWWIVAVMVAFLAVSVVTGWYLVENRDVLNAVIPPSVQQEYVEDAFVSYYDPGVSFGAMVWTNNSWIAAVCVASGITGIGPVYMLFQNAWSIGLIGAVMTVHGELGLFLQLLSPHGLLELTAIFVAGAAGLRVFWAWLAPGPRPRGQALSEAGRALFTTALGLVVVLGVSGLIEGFVTGSAMYWWLKIVIGAVALAGFWVYVLTLGRSAARAGETGDLEPDRAGYAVATAG